MAAASPSRQATKVPEIRKGDTVVVLTGKDAGKRGTVERVVRDPQGLKKTRTKYGAGSPGCRRSSRPRSSSRASTSPSATPSRARARARPTATPEGPAGRHPRPRPAAVDVSKVMVVCPHCDKPTRIAHRTLDDGRRVRVCRHCGEQLEAKA